MLYIFPYFGNEICYKRFVTIIRRKRCCRVPPSLAMLVLRAGNTSSWSTGEERSCRNAVRLWDWASLSFWPISVSKNSATSTVQRPSVTPDVSRGQSACGYLHFVPVQQTLLAHWQGLQRVISLCCLVLHHVRDSVQTSLLTGDTVWLPKIPERALLNTQAHSARLSAA